MGVVFSALMGGKQSQHHHAQGKPKLMTSPDLEDCGVATSALVSDLGEHKYAGIISLGPVGVGKSSFVNTVASFLSNRLEQRAAAGTGTESLTKFNKVHTVTYNGHAVKWKWMDTPGDFYNDLLASYTRTQLAKDSASHMTPEMYGTMVHDQLMIPMKQHNLGCVIAMVASLDASSGTERSRDGRELRITVIRKSRFDRNLQMLKDLYRRLVQADFRMVVVITKVDLFDSDVGDRMENIMYSEDVLALRECIAREICMPLNQVHPLVNLVRDFEPQANLALGYLAMFNVRCALTAAQSADLSRVPGVAPTDWDVLTDAAGSHCSGEFLHTGGNHSALHTGGTVASMNGA